MEFRFDRALVGGAYEIWSRPLDDEEWREVVAACGHSFPFVYQDGEDPRDFWRLRQLRRSRDGEVVKEYRSGSLPPSMAESVEQAKQLLADARLG